MNHNIDVSSKSAHFGIPKSLHGKIQAIVTKLCPDVSNSFFKLTDR